MKANLVVTSFAIQHELSFVDDETHWELIKGEFDEDATWEIELTDEQRDEFNRLCALGYEPIFVIR